MHGEDATEVRWFRNDRRRCSMKRILEVGVSVVFISAWLLAAKTSNAGSVKGVPVHRMFGPRQLKSVKEGSEFTVAVYVL